VAPPTTLAAAAIFPSPAPTPAATAIPSRADVSPTLAELSPRTCRRGGVVSFDLRGSGFRADHKARILRGGREVAGLKITKQSLAGSDHLRLTVFIGADVPLGSYSLVLAEPDGSTSEPVTFEVVL